MQIKVHNDLFVSFVVNMTKLLIIDTKNTSGRRSTGSETKLWPETDTFPEYYCEKARKHEDKKSRKKRKQLMLDLLVG